jgi:hypothetical protein
VDGGPGSDHFHGLDLRSSQAACRAVQVAHPLMLRAVAVAKKKNERIDAKKIAACQRCDFQPKCYMASTEIRERRRTLRYRNLLVRQTVQLKKVVWFRPFRRARILRFLPAFQGWKHGNNTSVEQLRRDLMQAL